MTHNPPTVPPVSTWPVMYPPDCPTCRRTDHVRWAGFATLDGADVHVWQCHPCGAEWVVYVTHWPVLDGPDCPYCHTRVTCWAAIEPNDGGDLWTCEHGHEFVLTPEGIVITTDDPSEWARVWRRDKRGGEAA